MGIRFRTVFFVSEIKLHILQKIRFIFTKIDANTSKIKEFEISLKI